MKSKLNIFVSAAIVALTFIACKPTEKNYRDAYDAALAKRQEVAAQQMRPATGLLSDEGPQRRIIGNDTVFVSVETLRTLDGKNLPGHFALAVGVFKMDTNAKAAAADLAEAGYSEAKAAKGREGRIYTLALAGNSLDSIKAASLKFKKDFPDYPYVGLPGAPVIISF